MEREPYTQSLNRPGCYGRSHDGTTELCAACSLADKCSSLTRRWSEVTSLAQAAHRSMVEFVLRRAVNPLDVYQAVHAEVYGQLRRGLHERWRHEIARSAAWCADNKIPFDAYVRANMVMMVVWVEKKPKVGFQPNMLLGENAANRYRSYISRSKRHRARRVSDYIDPDTPLGGYYREMHDEECEAAFHFWGRYMEDRRVQFVDTVSSAPVSDAWRGFRFRPLDGPALQERSKACCQFGVDVVEAMLDPVILNAACVVVDQVSPRLSERIGFDPPLKWESLAAVLRQIAPPILTAPVEGSPEIGLYWP